MAGVLIVDDNLFVRTLLRNILDHGGHTVAGEAPDGVEVASLVRDLDPDSVILDLVMPRRDGFAALEDLTRSAPNVPVLICSAALTAPRVVRALQLGAKGFISKPFDRESVLGALEAVADDRLETPPALGPPVSPGPAPGADERRNFPRVNIVLPIRLTTPSGDTVETSTVDVSGGGVLLATSPLDADAVVDFCLELGPNWRPITGCARVVRATATTRQALAFEQISIVGHEQLIRFLARAQSASAAAARSLATRRNLA